MPKHLISWQELNDAVFEKDVVGYKHVQLVNGIHSFCFLTIDQDDKLVSAVLCDPWEFVKMGWKMVYHGLWIQLTKRVKA